MGALRRRRLGNVHRYRIFAVGLRLRRICVLFRAGHFAVLLAASVLLISRDIRFESLRYEPVRETNAVGRGPRQRLFASRCRRGFFIHFGWIRVPRGQLSMVRVVGGLLEMGGLAGSAGAD